jgi:hypothetical protein
MSGSGTNKTKSGVNLRGPKALRLASATDRFAP